MKKYLSLVLIILISKVITAQPTLLLDINKGNGYSDVTPFTSLQINGKLFFTATSTTLGIELYITDGTPGGTKLVKDINTKVGEGSNPTNFIELNGKLLFAATDADHGTEYWISDGTENGTSLIKDVQPGIENGAILSFQAGGNIVKANNKVFFIGKDSQSSNPQLWESDGTTNGTNKLLTFTDAFTYYYPLIWYKNLLYTALELKSSIGIEIYTLNESTKSFELFKEFNSGSGDSYIYSIEIANDILYFARTNNKETGWEVYASDGTQSGTNLIYSTTTKLGFFPPSHFTKAGNNTFFILQDSLYVTQGTMASTKNLNVYVNLTGYKSWAVHDNKIYFVGEIANDKVGEELYESDGTLSGTKLVKDIYPGSNSSDINYLFFGNNTLYFTAKDNINGREIWSSNGTNNGTNLYYDITPGSSSSEMINLKLVNKKYLFFYQNSSVGMEPYAFTLLPNRTINQTIKTNLTSKNLGDEWQISIPNDIKISDYNSNINLYDINGIALKFTSKIEDNNIYIKYPLIEGVYFANLSIGDKYLTIKLLYTNK